jgi:hypothetical protein
MRTTKESTPAGSLTRRVNLTRLKWRTADIVRGARRFKKRAAQVQPEGIIPGRGITLHVGGGEDWGSYKGTWSSLQGLHGVTLREAVYLEEEYLRRGLPVPAKLALVLKDAEETRKSIAWGRARRAKSE